MAQLSKLQIRAKVLSVISEIKSLNTFSEDLMKKFIEELSDIEDKVSLIDIFIKEFIKLSENEYMFASCIIKAIVSVNLVQDKVFEILKSNVYSDDAKYKLVQLLRVVGSNNAYDAIPQYFDNPEEVLDKETQKLLENAVFNPEAMLDFLDFLYAVPPKDKKLLLSSLIEDYKGDALANIIYPILYADFDDEFKLFVIDILSESKSSLAIEPFNYLSQITDNQEVINACTVGLKKLKLAGASEEKADVYFTSAIKDFVPAEFYTTLPDGSGNQALLISRKNKEDKYAFQAVVVNDRYGIVDCFGFYNISKGEFDKIVAKFYKSEGKYKVSCEYIKTLINQALEQSIKAKRVLPYEFICWNILTRDIKPLDYNYVDFVNENIIVEDVEKDDILELLTKDFTLRWFISKDDNHFLGEVLDDFYKADNFEKDSITKMHTIALSCVDENLWKNRIYNLVYLLFVNNLTEDASKFYNILTDSKYFDLFKSILVQRSIFSHFTILRENQKEFALTVNIFRKKTATENQYDVKKIDNILDILKKCWIDG
ncbi:MAG: hypothetical protein E7Z90_05935 [Cyanobacteria bacterium SIG29]|nr:hypothetical protein [Cyanobacteria bacterium SIG29]